MGRLAASAPAPAAAAPVAAAPAAAAPVGGSARASVLTVLALLLTCVTASTSACAEGQLAGPDAGCELVPSSGCGPAQGCAARAGADGGLEVFCRAVTGDGTEVTPCTHESTCGKGFTCVAAATAGACARYCRTDAQCQAGPGSVCAIPVADGLGGMVLPGISACTTDCDPLTGGGCAAGWTCDVGQRPTATRAHTDCVPGGAGGHLAACTSISDCQAGFACVGPDGAKTCLQRCVVGSGTCDAPSTSCVALASHPTVGGTEYGVCSP